VLHTFLFNASGFVDVRH